MLHPLNWAGKGFLELDAGMVMSTKLGSVNMRMVVSISPPSLPDRKVEVGSSCNKYHNNKNSSYRIWSARFKSGWSSGQGGWGDQGICVVKW